MDAADAEFEAASEPSGDDVLRTRADARLNKERAAQEITRIKQNIEDTRIKIANGDITEHAGSLIIKALQGSVQDYNAMVSMADANRSIGSMGALRVKFVSIESRLRHEPSEADAIIATERDAHGTERAAIVADVLREHTTAAFEEMGDLIRGEQLAAERLQQAVFQTGDIERVRTDIRQVQRRSVDIRDDVSETAAVSARTRDTLIDVL